MAVQEQSAPNVRGKTGTYKAEPDNGFSWGIVGRYVAIVVVAFLALAPFYWAFITSIKSNLEQNFSPPTIVPESFTLSNYGNAFTSVAPAFAKDLLNSFIVASCTTILALIVGSLCAYAIARMQFKGKGAVLGIVLSVNLFPLVAIVGPLYVLFTGPIYVYNTYIALIIPLLVISLPLTVWFLTSFFRDLPPDLEEAALVDGDTRLGALWHVVLPLTAPGVFTAAILSFIAAWSDFITGLVLTTDSTAQPVTVAIPAFNGEHLIQYGEIAAAAIIVTIPLVVMVLIFQRRIVSGLTAGAVKG
ncbi:MAG: carbohydrate ABC transporter permease [Ktedonobacteraceae bacterium]